MSAELDKSASGADQIAELRAELDQRDTTIEQLVEQLEDAANRLDWISRGGADRNGQASESNSQPGHASLNGIQSETADRLECFLQQWEETDFGVSLDRIDRRLTHVFELLKSPESDDPAPQRVEAPQPSKSQVDTPSDFPSGSLLSAFLMNQKEDQTPKSAEQCEPPSSILNHYDNSTEVTSPTTEREALPHLPDFNIPPTIELESATIEELRAAITQRDECVQQLIARSRIAEENRTQIPDWQALSTAPDELRERITQLEDDLRQRIKQEELSRSIERAKLSRDQAHLEQVRRELEAQIRQLNQSQSHEDDDQAGDRKSGGKRWGKLFGR